MYTSLYILCRKYTIMIIVFFLKLLFVMQIILKYERLALNSNQSNQVNDLQTVNFK